eukprot:TRINITY_DN1785_c0_g2_i1.p1 TRINITY_DN1785_c0_g2~~TRINITY_DN1785_c0_g2_i1.p1  ORF type:complete len:1334 (+),score=432.24 TRINITY_DN1785_c0_g2_i1:119-4120(+)
MKGPKKGSKKRPATSKDAIAKKKAKVSSKKPLIKNRDALRELEANGKLQEMWGEYSSEKFTKESAIIMCALVCEKSKESKSLLPFETFSGDIPKFEEFFFKVLSQYDEYSYFEKSIIANFISAALEATDIDKSTVANAIKCLLDQSMLHVIDSALVEGFLDDLSMKMEFPNPAYPPNDRSKIIPNIVKSFVLWSQSLSVEQTSTNPIATTTETDMDVDSKNEENKEVPSAPQKNKKKMKKLSKDEKDFASRTLELFHNLLSGPLTRVYFMLALKQFHMLVIIKNSPLMKDKMLRELIKMIEESVYFPVLPFSMTDLSQTEVMGDHYDNVTSLQTAVRKMFGSPMSEFYLASVGQVDHKKAIDEQFGELPLSELWKLYCSQGWADDEHGTLVPASSKEEEGLTDIEEHVLYHEVKLTKPLLLDAFTGEYKKTQQFLKSVNEMSLFPSETELFDETKVPLGNTRSDNVLALAKITNQYLTFGDFLKRNFQIYRMEAAYEIRSDLVETVKRVDPRMEMPSMKTIFTGYDRNATPIEGFKLVSLKKAEMGQMIPASVEAEVEIDLGMLRERDRLEWNSIREHDVLFLLSIRSETRFNEPRKESKSKGEESLDFPERYGLRCVRGCRVTQVKDEGGKLYNDPNASSEDRDRKPIGSKRTFVVLLDPAQYHSDAVEVANGKEDPYEGDFLNMLVRRSPETNNFWSVLKTIRDLMNESRIERIIPGCLQQVVLGRGSPTAAHYSSEKVIRDIGVQPTNLDVKSYCPFELTDVQKEAVHSGLMHGLTMIVGPPGTGKTDVAVQTIVNIVKNFPNQKTLLITHSNHALNDLFRKIMNTDISGRHLLRLGRGERDLETDEDYSKFGRTNWCLGRRIELLNICSELAKSLDVDPDRCASCASADFFHFGEIQSRIEEFEMGVMTKKDTIKTSEIKEIFPFSKFFDTQGWDNGEIKEDMEVEKALENARFQFTRMKSMFEELNSFRAFEMMRTQRQRANHLLTYEAKVVALTCTHAAITRQQLLDLDFRFDNIIMEEAGQILEVETLVPMLLQRFTSTSTLRRVCLIGDHRQLPPIVQNMALAKFSNFEQSLFARLIKNGVPAVWLNKQGRARKTIADLYRWRYEDLQDLDNVSTGRYLKANAGMTFPYQFIDVAEGQETTPRAWFYQNPREAAWIVTTFKFLRLVGHPADKISILTTYNGQRFLLEDMFNKMSRDEQACYERPKISTVDKFQGQQNDIIMLSLVRSKTVGHLRDIRRLVVAMSRAKLGLYIFGQKKLFSQCLELAPTMKQFVQPNTMEIMLNETYPTERPVEKTDSSVSMKSLEQLGLLTKQMYDQLLRQLKSQ